MADYSRKTAYKVSIGELLKGRYVKREGWEPNYVEGKDGLEISRVNILSMAVALENTETNSPSLILDDGTGRIEARAFENRKIFSSVEVGSIVNVIGRPREYNGQLFITPEIVKEISNPKWAEVRKLELGMGSLILEKEEKRGVREEAAESGEKSVEAGRITEGNGGSETEIEEVHDEGAESPSQKVFNLIKELDIGSGADYDEVVKKAEVDNVEKIISNLLMEGDIFEIRSGKLKVLD